MSPEGAAVFLPASFFSAGALPAGALPPVVGVFWALGGILVSVGVWEMEKSGEGVVELGGDGYGECGG